MDNLQPWVGSGDIVDNLTRMVSRVIVYDNHFKFDTFLIQYRVEGSCNILLLIAGRNNHTDRLICMGGI
jgi:hypothetical protein